MRDADFFQKNACKFDLVMNMFYSFGFFSTDSENRSVLENFFLALRDGGKFLMHTDVNIPRIITGRYRMDETRTLAQGGILHIQESYDPITKRMNGSWTIDGVQRDYSVRVY